MMKQKTKAFLQERKKEVAVALVIGVSLLLVIILYAHGGSLIVAAGALPALCVAALFGMRKAIMAYAACVLPLLLLRLLLPPQDAFSAEMLAAIGMTLLISILAGRIQDMHGTIQGLQAEIVQLNGFDALTNLLNRRVLLEFAEQEFKKTERLHFAYHEAKTKKTVPGVFSVALIDIDSFKEINDRYGHTSGDEVLRTMGHVLSSFGLLRGSDLKGRYGGKVFLVLLPHTVAKHARIPLKKLSDEFKSIQFVAGEERNFTASFTCGVAQYERDDRSMEDVVKKAEDALASAKSAGRDRIAVYEAPEKHEPETSEALAAIASA